MQKYEVIVRLILAITVGGLIGYERSFNNRPAGFRTHILVCVGATIVSIIQIQMIEETKALIIENPILAQSLKADIGRMGAQVITGVGFLGAGTIIREKGLVKGLTTAASVWAVACIGLAVGLGMYFISIVSTISVFISLVILKKVETRFIDRSRRLNLEIEYCQDGEFMKIMQKYFKKNNIKVSNIKFSNEEIFLGEELDFKKTIYTVDAPRCIKDTRIVQDLCRNEGVLKVKIV